MVTSAWDRAAQSYFDPPDERPVHEEEDEDEAYERYRDIERMEREDEQAMEEAASGLPFGGSE